MLQKWAASEHVLRQRFVVHSPGGVWVEREPELLVPIEREPGAAQRVVAVAGAFAAAGQIGGVGGDFVGEHSLLHVFAVGQAKMLASASHSRAWRRRSNRPTPHRWRL